ncbi:hypothetical protein G647_05932 [Cladophialophora carrionii CBS 160.54]|uniref:Transcription factor domain-containing protein n=1 Tax=Cladophialophora carrionii CBS 160.54 TaxID=1279043 RepID=V9D6G5_9EURO|nr:uncharacterized protein G647_05932 [Cladophialophora carrionii CBS 160.54]ETI21863.1 hypothetical protein G647_05932 [Cladophialophora carrionii CBS 160.54]
MAVLLAYYFHNVCAINSCFDSFVNPLRTEVAALITTSRLIEFCILSMSAAHLSNSHPHWSLEGLGYLTATVSELSRAMNGVITVRPLSTAADQDLGTVLLGVIMLGMTTSWHASSGLGLEHISGSRALFRTWIAQECTSGQAFDGAWPRLHFYLGLQAYWEAMASFLIDQDIHQLDYLHISFAIDRMKAGTVHPWTGISAVPWLYLAKAGCVIRSHRNRDRGETLWDGISSTKAVTSHQPLSEDCHVAHVLAKELLHYRPPSDAQIEDTFDEHTSKSQLQDLARCCQLAALVELIRSCDSIDEQQAMATLIADNCMGTSSASAVHVDVRSEATCTDLLRDLSVQILRLLSGIPTDSGTRCLYHLPLLIAGSVLLPSIMSLSHTQCGDVTSDKSSACLYWRRFVTERVMHLEQSVNLEAHRRIRLLLTEVWARGDALPVRQYQALTPRSLHWVDVMEDANLRFFI